MFLKPPYSDVRGTSGRFKSKGCLTLLTLDLAPLERYATCRHLANEAQL
jgi:hypothetical protein